MSTLVVTLANPAWAQLPEVKLVPSDGTTNDRFGTNVAIDENVAIISSPSHDGSGASTIFRFDGSTWIEEVQLPSGPMVEVSGDLAFVGRGSDGFASVYRFDGLHWNLEATLVASDLIAGDTFGGGLSYSDGKVTVRRGGAENAIYVFRDTGAGWVEEAKISPTNPTAGDFWGRGPGLSGDVLVAGAHQRGDGLEGYAEVFRYDGTSWNHEAILTASDGMPYDEFGIDLSIDGDVIGVWSWRNDEGGGDAGAAYLYRFDGAIWNEEQKLLASNIATNDRYGEIEVLGNLAVVGSYRQDSAGSNAGAAYLYRFDGVSWIEEAILTASDAAANDRFGWDVGITNGRLLIGSQRTDVVPGDDVGGAYVYEFSFDTDGDGLDVGIEGVGAEVEDLLRIHQSVLVRVGVVARVEPHADGSPHRRDRGGASGVDFWSAAPRRHSG